MAKADRKRRVAAGEGFWGSPSLMNLVADLLLVFALAALGWAAVRALERLPIQPLRELVVVSEVSRVGRGQIEHVARTTLAGNLFAVDLTEARAAFEKLPWVRKASLRRQWPNGLELELEEHVAVARWVHPDGEGRLLNSRGEVFAANGADALPVFSGPEWAAPMMLERFREFDARLAAVQRKPVALTLTAREAWQVKLDDGVLLDLGRDQPKQPLAARLERFAAHYAEARAKARLPIAAVDMRYPNGFVLRLGTPSTAIRS